MVHNHHHHRKNRNVEQDEELQKVHFERLSVDEIMNKNFEGHVNDINQEIEEVMVERTRGKNAAEAYDAMQADIDGGVKIQNYDDKQVDQDKANKERLQKERLVREEARKKKKEQPNQAEEIEVPKSKNKSYSEKAKDIKMDLEELFCCVDRSTDAQHCPNKRPPK